MFDQRGRKYRAILILSMKGLSLLRHICSFKLCNIRCHKINSLSVLREVLHSFENIRRALSGKSRRTFNILLTSNSGYFKWQISLVKIMVVEVGENQS